MPELPEVEIVATALDSALRSLVLDSVTSLGRLRLPFDEDLANRVLSGRKFVRVRRRAKYILLEFCGEYGLIAHLGMTGSFRVEDSDLPLQKHDRLVFRLMDGRELRFSDPRRFGFVQVVEMPGSGKDPEELSGLGCEPLERGFSAKNMHALATGRKCPVKILLMNQSFVAGVGNIYASEALFRAGIDPRRQAGLVSLDEWRDIINATRKVLRNAIKAGGSTIRDYQNVDGGEGRFQRRLLVYGRGGKDCSRCGQPIDTIRLGGRSTFFCSRCQS